MANDRSKRLAEGPIGRLLLSLSLPAIVGLLAQALYNAIDRAFVGHAFLDERELAIAGIAVAYPFMLLMLSLGMLIGFGAAALVSIRLGQQRRRDAEQVLGNATVLLVVGSVILTGIGWVLIDPLLRTFGASDAVLPYAREYLEVIVLGTVFQVVGFGLNAVIRGEGNPRIAMLTMLLSVVLNAVLAPIFLFGFRWGMRGAGLATVVSQAATAIWVLVYFLGGDSLLRLRLRNLRLQGAVCASILGVGSQPAFMQAAAVVLNSLLNHQLGKYGAELGPEGGDLAISIAGIIYPVLMLILMPIFGINQGAQPIIGYNYGARRFDRVRRTLTLAMLAATSIAVLGFAAAMRFPVEIFRLFGMGEETIVSIGAPAMRICFLMLPIVGFQVVGANYFLAVGKPKQGMLLAMSRQLLILIPALVVLPRFLGLDGVWTALPAADLGSSLVTATWLWMELRRLDRSHAAETVAIAEAARLTE